MSKFHSIMTRRDFMKILGLSATGMGAASIVAPAFHDLDEVSSTSAAGFKRSWWVKDVEEPTLEIDWSQIKRFDHRPVASNYAAAQHWGKDKWLELAPQGAAAKKARQGTPGWQLRDWALATGGARENALQEQQWMGIRTTTPDILGFPKWQGTPEENTRLIRAAGICYGATQISTAELGSKERNLVYTYTRGGPLGNNTDMKWIDQWPQPAGYWKKIEFGDVDVGYTAPIDGVADALCVLPDRPLWDISIMIPMAKEAWRTSSDGTASSEIWVEANGARYRMFHCSLLPSLQKFITALGYHSYGYARGDGAGGDVPAEASAILSGLAEQGRSSEIVISPEYGPVTGYYSLITDLPLGTANPVDAGIRRFCHTCKKCAEMCPSGAIPLDTEPTWDIPDFDYKVPNIWQRPGKKLHWIDLNKCMSSITQMGLGLNGCPGRCRGICTMNVNNSALVHETVKSMVSTTSIFNGFLWNMGKSFGYGTLHPDDWWDMAGDLPTWGTFPRINTTRGI
ncbi:MAG: reductive dehalogenase [Dehalogenimonas sp.]